MLYVIDSGQSDRVNDSTININFDPTNNTTVHLKSLSIPSHIQEEGPIYFRIRNLDSSSKLVSRGSKFDFFAYVPSVQALNKSILTSTQVEPVKTSTFSYIFTSKSHIQNICLHFDQDIDSHVSIQIFKNGKIVLEQPVDKSIFSIPLTFKGSNSHYKQLPVFNNSDLLEVKVISEHQEISYRAHYCLAQSETVTYSQNNLEHNLPIKLKATSSEFYIEIYDKNFQPYNILEENSIVLAILFQ
tara:strand:+ start:136 stop:864 length:729 start_codon:yes stop_codon:yes gene_type:complete